MSHRLTRAHLAKAVETRSKIAGWAVLAGPVSEGPAGDLFVADISEVVITRLSPEATLLVIESWTPQRGLRVAERE
jgi:hypothetical protein